MIVTKIKPSEIRQALLEAAKENFFKGSIAATEMKAIAATAGLSRSTLYRYVIDKNQLAFLVATDVLQTISSQCLSFSVKADSNGYQKLHDFACNFGRILCDNVDLVSFLAEFDTIYRGDYPDIPEAKEYISTINRMLHLTAQFFFEGLADGSIECKQEPLFFISVLVNTIFGLAQRLLPRNAHYLQEHGTTAEKLLFGAIDILLESIRKE